MLFLRIKNRLAKQSRGSVLIVVVSLLVMLAMMGTAYMATARLDRQRVEEMSTIIPLDFAWLDSEVAKVKKTVSEGVMGTITAPNPGSFRPLNVPTEYVHFTSAHPDPLATGNKYDSWLSERFPELMGFAGTYPNWRTVTRMPSTIYRNMINSATIVYDPASPTTGLWNPTAHYLQATSITMDPTHAVGTPVVMPAFQPIDRMSGAPVGTAFLAADADGDGIADSLLYEIPNAYGAGGVTYYSAVRIIDNNSAVNAMLAWSNVSDFDFTAPNPGSIDALGTVNPAPTNLGMFPSHISLKELLDYNPGVAAAFGANQMTYWNAYRMGTVSPTANPFADNGGQRTDFNYISQGDFLFQQLARRLNNPGRNGQGLLANTKLKASSDDQFLAYRFGMLNPALNASPFLSAFTAPAAIEREMGKAVTNPTNPPLVAPPSASYDSGVYHRAINWVYKRANQWSQYPANRTQYWYSYNFFRDGTTETLAANDADGIAATLHVPKIPLASPSMAPGWDPSGNIRHLITTSNPVSNAIQAHTTVAGTNSIPLPPAIGVSVANSVSGMNPYPSVSPLTVNPTKVSINTAPFGDLWRGFWNVMANDANATLFAGAANRQCRVGSTGMATESEVMYLRSALAAVNAIDLRDGDFTPTAATISIGGKSVTVYGSEPQLYITGVTIDAAGLVRLMLYNPSGNSVEAKDYVIRTWSGGGAISTPVVTLPASFTVAPNAVQTLPPLSAVQSAAVLGKTLVITTNANNISTNAVDNYAPVDAVVMPASGTTSQYYRRLDSGNGGLPWNSNQGVAAGGFVGGTPATLSTTAATFTPQYNLQIANYNTLMASRVTAATGNKFPFGGFARDGDLLQVPFIGGYRVGDTATTTAYRSLSLDVLDADDGDGGNNTVEQVGRFVPLAATSPGYAGTDYYDFAKRIFDYFTTIHNQDADNFPNVDATAAGAFSAPYPGTSPQPVSNGGAQPGSNAEQTASVSEGRINLNTAPWQVLKTIPFTTSAATNETIAKAIVTYRNNPANGPFRTIFDLNKVGDTSMGFQNGWAGTPIATLNPGIPEGDFSPDEAPTIPGGVPGDFEAMFAQLTRISNLVTVRSDTFTCYVLVQAWKGAGTPAAQFMGQRRVGFVVDRTAVTPADTTPKSTNIQY